MDVNKQKRTQVEEQVFLTWHNVFHNVFFTENANLDKKVNNVKTVDIRMLFEFTSKTNCIRTRWIEKYIDAESFTIAWLMFFDM